jgi:hypothetical protein
MMAYESLNLQSTQPNPQFYDSITSYCQFYFLLSEKWDV